MDPHTAAIPPVLEPLLDWWLERIAACLSGRVCSVLLHGGVVFGDFCPGWSDVDVCVVLDGPVTEAEGLALGSIHDAMRDRFLRDGAAGWCSGQAIEGFYIPTELVADAACQMPCYTAGGRTRQWAVGHPVSPFDRQILAQRGHVIQGVPLAFAMPTRQALAGQTSRDLASLRQMATGTPSAIWLCGIQHWLARSLVFWRDGELLSKSASLRHEVATGSPFAEAFAFALRIRQEGSATANQHHAELARCFAEYGLRCAAEIEARLPAV